MDGNNYNAETDYYNQQNQSGASDNISTYPKNRDFRSDHQPSTEAGNLRHQEQSANFAYTNKKRKPGFAKRISTMLRNLGIFVVLLIFVLSLVFAYILAKPKDKFSRFFTENSPLSSYLNTPSSNTEGSKVDSVVKSIKQISGLEETQDVKYFQFAKPAGSKSTVEIVQDVLPSVLSISVRSVNQRLGVSDQVAGTGYIVSEDGLVVTNKHVIAKECSDTNNNVQIFASNHDQKAYELELLTVDPIDDVAILKIQSNNEKFAPVKFADSSKAPLGSEVIAIGNVLGQLRNSVTKGIVSGVNRSIEGGTSQGQVMTDECTNQSVSSIDGLVQTDAAINKGNSGGPLFDSNGLLLAMNTLGTTEAQNVGLAIPSNIIISDLNSYRNKGKVVRARLGVFTQTITPLIKRQNTWLPVDSGEIISNPENTTTSAVSKDSAADKAGLKTGDIILEFNGEKITYSDENNSPLRRLILNQQADTQIELLVLKAVSENDGKYQYEANPAKVNIKLGGTSYDLKKSATNGL